MQKLNELISELTLEEKAALLEGVDSWMTNAIPRLDIPALYLTDGPHGLRKVRKSRGGFGVGDNEHSTAFPTSVTLASTWNPDNARQMGEAIARECADAQVDVLLAPGVNIKRSPLCGRNFEYFSEDPLLTGVMGSAFVRGVQSRGVGCSIKHFAANSNENYRFTGDSAVDPRALREIYLRAFERIVKETGPYTVMCSYNRLNGIFASQNSWLLTKILREDWGFDGLVVTDWGATCNRVEGVKAGCDLDMPGSVWYNRRGLIEAVKAGTLRSEVLDKAVGRVLNLIGKCAQRNNASRHNAKDHARLSLEIAMDGAVLLKNDGILPLSGKESLLVVGEMFEKVRYQGAGSSLINPPEVITPKDAFDRRGIAYAYEKGYEGFEAKGSPEHTRAVLTAAQKADTILFFGGLTDFEESEGFDREHMKMGESQTSLIKELVSAGKKVVLVLFAGAPVELPFFEGLSALLNMYLPGMYGGEAACALLYGEANPSGKLAESWPLCAEDSSCYGDYNRKSVSIYYESIYVGYRFYDKAQTPLNFPFGYGLSYTTFLYGELEVSENSGQITVNVQITNNGLRDGGEVVQLYVKNGESQVFKAEKELRAFTKIYLKTGQTGTAKLVFNKSDLAYWNQKREAWVLENGTYTLCIAASAWDIRLTAPLHIKDCEKSENPYSEVVASSYAMPPRDIPACFSELLGGKVQPLPEPLPLTLESPLGDLPLTKTGRFLHRIILLILNRDYTKALKNPNPLERDTQLKNAYFLTRMMPYNSLRSMSMSSGGRLTGKAASALVMLANGQYIRGLWTLIRREKIIPLPSGRKR